MTRYREAITRTALFLADLLWLQAVTVLAIYIRYYSGLVYFPGRQAPWISLVGFVALTHVVLFPSLLLAGAYRVPRRWRISEAQSVVSRALLSLVAASTVLMFTFRVGGLEWGPVLTPSRLVVVWVWFGLFVGLISVRVWLGRFQLVLYRRGLGLRRAVVVGDGPEAVRVVQSLRRHPWLGESVVGRLCNRSGADVLGAPDDLEAIVEKEGVHVVWLTPPAETGGQLPSLLFQPGAQRVIWRALPDHFDRIASSAPLMIAERQELFYERVRHDLDLPTMRLAMLGSRGVPANYGGVEKYVEEVGSHLAQDGAAVVVYCHRKYVAARGTYRGMELRFVPCLRTKHLETISHTFLATLHALLNEEEIFHYQALGPSTLSWLPRLLGRRVVVTVHGLDWQGPKWGPAARLFLRFGEWAAARFPHRTIVVSETLRDYYLRRRGRSTAYIPNGFEPPTSRAPDLIQKLGLGKNGYVLFVGRLIPGKGCDTLVRAFSRVRTDKQLVLAGAAAYEDDYARRLRQEARVSKRVRFVGFVRDRLLQELYSNAYFVVHPSEVEGRSISLQEALSYDNCVVVSNTPENVEVIQDNGYSFKTGSADDLAQRMQLLFDRPGLVETMRHRVHSRLATLRDWRAVADATRQQYESLLETSR